MIAFRFCEAVSGSWPPERNAIPATVAEQRYVNSLRLICHQSWISLFRHLYLQESLGLNQPAQFYFEQIQFLNRNVILFSDCCAAFDGMVTIHHFGSTIGNSAR
ncbi:hypothetical protein CS542_07265 [Pedobacter sp. IW39]|nr:hypothetical protein CS542_07265 [Pedobacter sp. IW39]